MPIFGTVEYVNVPGIIGVLVSSRIATLAELSNVYGAEDAYNLLEILTVDRHNEKVYQEHADRH